MYLPIIRLESLPKEYREKLRARELTRETIDSLAGSISKKYQAQKRAFTTVAIILPAATILMAVLSLFAPAANAQTMPVVFGAVAFTVVAEIGILAVVYYGALVRVPRQFAASLKEGYPELTSVYGYEQLLNGSLAGKKASRQLPFSLEVEDTFNLKDSEDVVAVGFAHGLIERGNSVFIIDKNDPSHERACGIVSGIEKTGSEPVSQAADCKVGLRIQKGARLGVVPGVYLYREQ